MTVVTLQPVDNLLEECAQTLAGKARSTAEVYLRTLRHFTAWIAARPGTGGHCRAEHCIRMALETYLAYLEAEGYSVSHRARVKSAAGSFARWLIEEHGLPEHRERRRAGTQRGGKWETAERGCARLKGAIAGDWKG